MVSLFFMYYNFCRVYQTLRVTPAMEAGITDHVWSVEEIVALLGAYAEDAEDEQPGVRPDEHGGILRLCVAERYASRSGQTDPLPLVLSFSHARSAVVRTAEPGHRGTEPELRNHK
jgi:hypothetical protein